MCDACEAFSEGYEDGWNQGYEGGFSEGYDKGYEEGQWIQPTRQRFTLVSDEDGHRYCVPVDKVEEWYELSESFYRAIGNYNYNVPDFPPEWAERVEGRLTFEEPKT